MDTHNERFEKIEKLIEDNFEITKKLLNHMDTLRKEIKDHIEDQLTIAFNLQILKDKINDIGNKTIANSERLLQSDYFINKQKDEIQQLTNYIEVLVKHIAVLEKRNTSFLKDKIRIIGEKIYPITNEINIKSKKISFTLNDE